MGIAIIVSFARLAQTASNNDSTKMPAHYVGNNSVIVMSLRVNILNFIIDLGSCDEKTIDFTRKTHRKRAGKRQYWVFECTGAYDYFSVLKVVLT